MPRIRNPLIDLSWQDSDSSQSSTQSQGMMNCGGKSSSELSSTFSLFLWLNFEDSP